MPLDHQIFEPGCPSAPLRVQDGRIDQDLGMNQDGVRLRSPTEDGRMDQDYDMKIASLTIINPNSVGAYCISPHPILNIL